MTTLLSDHRELLNQVTTKGSVRDTRGGRTIELLPRTWEFSGGFIASVTKRPKSLRAIGVVEGVALIAGVDASKALLRIAPKMKAFADDGVFLGGYGPLAARQWDRVIDELRDTPASRRAVVALYSAEHAWSIASNIPCTCTLQFFSRFGEVDMHVHMRSNDAWKGFTYDLVAFRIAQLHVAACLGLYPGRIFWTAGSMHLYEYDLEAAAAWSAGGDAIVATEYSNLLIGRGKPIHPLTDHQEVAANWGHTIALWNQGIQCGQLDSIGDLIREAKVNERLTP